jgi:hypothetical protein
VSAEIYWNYQNAQGKWPRVLKAVALLGGEIPAVTSLKELEALYAEHRLPAGVHCYQTRPYAAFGTQTQEVRIYQGKVIRAEDFDDLAYGNPADDPTNDCNDDEDSAPVRRVGDDPMILKPGKILAEFANPAEEVIERARRYRNQHPTVSVEQSVKTVLADDPYLAAAYTAMPWIIPPRGGAPMQEPISAAAQKEAEDFLTADARKRMAQAQHLTFEQAFRLSCQAYPEELKRYLGRL